MTISYVKYILLGNRAKGRCTLLQKELMGRRLLDLDLHGKQCKLLVHVILSYRCIVKDGFNTESMMAFTIFHLRAQVSTIVYFTRP